MNQNQPLDLNLRHYSGDRHDVIKEIKSNIGKYLRSPGISEASRSIYSTLYNALTYYQNISDLSISGETADKTFLENTIYEFNKDYEYLSKKYNSKDPNAPKVIQAKGRIKSPISAVEKILEKISEYIKDGMDLRNLNNSLRDFIGLRIIINPPEEIKSQGKEAEANFCYQVFNDLLTFRGLSRQIQGEVPSQNDYRFVKVNTVHDPNKLERLKWRSEHEGFIYDPNELGIYIPTERPEYIEKFDEYFKDYQKYPNARLYQRLHICAHPFFANYIPSERIPNYIIPSTATDTCIEYQVCTLDEEEFAEHGKAAHTEYKGERDFHRLGIPLFMKVDENTDKIRLTRLDEAMEEFYGYSFQSMFNIDYQTFLRTFDASQRDNILAGRLTINYDQNTDEYVLLPSATPLFIDSNQNIDCIQQILQTATPEELKRFYDKNGILDNTISPTHDSTLSCANEIQIYSIEQPLEPLLTQTSNTYSTNPKYSSNLSVDYSLEHE